MSKIKVVIDFSDYPASTLATLGRTIHEAFAKHTDTFLEPPVSVAALGALVEDYAEKLVARQSRAAADVLALKQARKALERALGVLGHYVNGIARSNAVMVEKSGFPTFSTARTRDYSPPAAPADLRLRHLTVSGSVLARYRPARRHTVHEVQITTGDPTDESGWQTYGYFPKGRAEISGQPPGVIVWVRVRTAGLRGVMGAWSDPAQIRVL